MSDRVELIVKLLEDHQTELMNPSIRRHWAEAIARADESMYMKLNDEVCQVLGKVLGYPWYKDHQKNFPGSTEKDGVCVADGTAESLADQAAERIKNLELQLEEIKSGSRK